MAPSSVFALRDQPGQSRALAKLFLGATSRTTRRPIGEGSGRVVLAPMQALDELAHDRHGDLGMLLEQRRELPGREEEALGLGVGDDRCRPRMLLDERQLTEE